MEDLDVDFGGHIHLPENLLHLLHRYQTPHITTGPLHIILCQHAGCPTKLSIS